MADLFLSYASEDRGRAAALAQLLEARGWCVWWDRQIFIGEAFDKAIERELENAKGQYYRDVIADSAGPSRSDVSVNGYRADSRGRFDHER
jgi:TIR domain